MKVVLADIDAGDLEEARQEVAALADSASDVLAVPTDVADPAALVALQQNPNSAPLSLWGLSALDSCDHVLMLAVVGLELVEMALLAFALVALALVAQVVLQQNPTSALVELAEQKIWDHLMILAQDVLVHVAMALVTLKLTMAAVVVSAMVVVTSLMSIVMDVRW